MTRRPHSPAARAFTLIEVTVGLAIFAFAGFMLAGAYVNVLNAQQAALRRDDRAPAMRLVRAALRAQPDPEELKDWNDIPLPEGTTVRWRATIAPTTIADLFDVTVEAEFTDAKGGKLPVVTETCQLLRPTWSEPAERDTLRAASRSRLAQRPGP